MDNKSLSVKSFKTLYPALLTKFKGMIKKSDWNQNDKNADDYIKNRTHYTEMVDGVEVVYKLDEKYIPDSIIDNIKNAGSNKMDKENPVGTGSFSMNRDAFSYIGEYSFAEGQETVASGRASHAEGGYTKAINTNDGVITVDSNLCNKGDYSHAEGYGTVAYGAMSHAEGNGTKASGNESHAEGKLTTASGRFSHAEGKSTTASSGSSHAEGSNTTASGDASHAEGSYTTASGIYSHAEGNNTRATSTDYSSSGTDTTTTKGYCTHAEGSRTIAYGAMSHAEGNSTKTSGIAAHSEGCNTLATGNYSHVEGYQTKASSAYQHVQGKYNVSDAASKYAHIVGNGTSDTKRSNAHTLDWEGNAWYAGNIQATGLNLGGFAAFNYDPVTGSIVLSFTEESE